MMLGMNFQEIDHTAVEGYLNDDDWWMQQKLDGTRALVRVSRFTKEIDFFQRNGQPLKHTAAMQHFEGVRQALQPLLSDSFLGYTEIWLDGEILIREGTYHIFDAPAATSVGVDVLEAAPYAERYFWLMEVARYGLEPDGAARFVTTATSPQEKMQMFQAARALGVEGVVLKHAANVYRPGVRVNDVLKVKFVKTADVVVMGSSRRYTEAGREVGAFTFGIYDPDGPDDGFRVFGSCSAIGKPDAQVGDVIEVAYLYREPGGGLVQPRMVRIREDKEPEDCREDQFPAYSREVI